MKSKPKIIIVGCGRSGTKYISKTLEEAGIHVGHEYSPPDSDGLSSWYVTVSDFEKYITIPYHGSQLIGFTIQKNDKFISHLPEGATVLHQVRDPLNTIVSFKANCSISSWRFVHRYLPEIYLEKDSLLLKTMKYWYYWNQIAEKKAEWTYRVESLFEDKIFKEFCLRLKRPELLKTKPLMEATNRQTNTGKNHPKNIYEKLTWDDLYEEDYGLTVSIKKLGRFYGYDI